MQVERLESFKDLSEDDTSLLESVGQRNFYCGAHWFRNFENHGLESEATLCIYTVKAEPEGQSIALLALRWPAGQGGSVLHGRAPGSRSLASLTSFQSTLFDISMQEDCPSASDAVETIARSIREDRPAWGLVDIDLMDSASRNYPLLIGSFRAAGWVVRPYKHIVTVYEVTTGVSYSDYLASRPSVLRNTLKRKTKQLEKSGQSRFELITRGTQLDKGIEAYVRVQAASWKEPERFAKYEAGLIQECAAAGVLRLGVLYLDDVPTAVQFWIIAGGRATIYKLHYDETFKRLSVGTILTAHMMRHIIDVDHVDEIDFGRGDESYKRAWLPRERQMCGFVAFHWKNLAGLTNLTHQLVAELSSNVVRLLKPFLKPPLDAIRRLTKNSPRNDWDI